MMGSECLVVEFVAFDVRSALFLSEIVHKE